MKMIPLTLHYDWENLQLDVHHYSGKDKGVTNTWQLNLQKEISHHAYKILVDTSWVWSWSEDSTH